MRALLYKTISRAYRACFGRVPQSVNVLFLGTNDYKYGPSQKWNGYVSVIDNPHQGYDHTTVSNDSLLMPHASHLDEREVASQTSGGPSPEHVYGTYQVFLYHDED